MYFERGELSPGKKKVVGKLRPNYQLYYLAVRYIDILPSKLLCRELKTYDINGLTLRDTTLVKRNIRNDRLSVHPNVPKNITETHVDINLMKLVTN